MNHTVHSLRLIMILYYKNIVVFLYIDNFRTFQNISESGIEEISVTN